MSAEDDFITKRLKQFLLFDAIILPAVDVFILIIIIPIALITDYNITVSTFITLFISMLETDVFITIVLLIFFLTAPTPGYVKFVLADLKEKLKV